MEETEIAETHQVARKAPPVSRTLRLLSGCGLLFWTAVSIYWLDWKNALILFCTFVGLFVYYALVYRLIGRREVSWGVRKAASILPASAFLVGHVAGILDIQIGVVAFFGVSLVVQALRGDRGCEVMTLATLLFRRPVHFPCLIFSPIDQLEESIYRAIRNH